MGKNSRLGSELTELQKFAPLVKFFFQECEHLSLAPLSFFDFGEVELAVVKDYFCQGADFCNLIHDGQLDLEDRADFLETAVGEIWRVCSCIYLEKTLPPTVWQSFVRRGWTSILKLVVDWRSEKIDREALTPAEKFWLVQILIFRSKAIKK